MKLLPVLDPRLCEDPLRGFSGLHPRSLEAVFGILGGNN